MVKYEELDMEVMEFSIDDVVTNSCALPNECKIVGDVSDETEMAANG